MQIKYTPLFVGLGIGACQTSIPISSSEAELVRALNASPDLVVSPKAQAADLDLSQTELPSWDFASYENRAEVQRWIKYYQGRGRKTFDRHLARGQKYKTLISTLLQQSKVPGYFYYLAMIESGFSVRARSRAAAVGMWQFVKGTGKRYGLRINRYIDERRDPIRATLAAAEYLNDLRNVFDSWPLAMAAYNAGEGRIMGLIMRHGTRDYWELVERKALPRETASYVPKFIAAAIMGEDPERFGFAKPPEDRSLPTVTAVSVPSPVRLSKIASVSKIPLKTLKTLNPHISRGLTPPSKKTYRIWLPENSSSTSEPRLASLQRIKLAADPLRAGSYRVRRGDNLYDIARRARTSVRNIKRWNNLRGNLIKPGQRLVLGPSATNPGSYKRYRVKKGDNLITLARRFGMSIKVLKRINSLRRATIYEGQWLNVVPRKS